MSPPITFVPTSQPLPLNWLTLQSPCSEHRHTSCADCGRDTQGEEGHTDGHSDGDPDLHIDALDLLVDLANALRGVIETVGCLIEMLGGAAHSSREIIPMGHKASAASPRQVCPTVALTSLSRAFTMPSTSDFS